MEHIKKHRIREILELYKDRYLRSADRKLYITEDHLKAMNSILICQTARLGIGEFECKCCGEQHIIYQSCKHRFCSICGARETNLWARRLLHTLPDMRYHHVVFTLPKPLRIISKRNGNKVYDLMFRLSAEIVQEWFKRKHALQTGIINVLHTSGSDLKYHPHIHMIVLRGGLNKEEEVVDLAGRYLCPQYVWGKHFRRRLIEELVKIVAKDEASGVDLKGGARVLDLPVSLGSSVKLERWLKTVKEKHWVVNIDYPLSGVERLISYVGRYTRRSCISEYRLESIDNDQISFKYKDYKNSKKGEKPLESIISMDYVSFLDRLFQHLPSKGYRMVRYYGLFYGSNKKKIPAEKRIKREVSELMSEAQLAVLEQSGLYGQYRAEVARSTGKDPLWCYECNQEMKFRRFVKVDKYGVLTIREPIEEDSS